MLCIWNHKNQQYNTIFEEQQINKCYNDSKYLIAVKNNVMISTQCSNNSVQGLNIADFYESDQQNYNAKNILINLNKCQIQEASRLDGCQQKNTQLQGNHSSNQDNYSKRFQIPNDDTLKQYVHRKVRQELSYILNSSEQTQPSKVGFKKQDLLNDFYSDKYLKNQQKEYAEQNEGARVKVMTDFQVQSSSLEKCLHNRNVCITEVNLSSQVYTKHLKNKQKYFQLHKSQQSPLLIPCNNPTFENRKNFQKAENQRYEEIKKVQQQNLAGSSYFDNQDINFSRLRQYSSASPMNWDQFYQNNQQDLNFYNQNQFDLQRSQMKTRISPRKKMIQDKSINDNSHLDSKEEVCLSKPKFPYNKVKRGYSVDQNQQKSSEVLNPTFLQNCRSNLISYFTDLPSDSNDNNSSIYYNNQSNCQKKIVKRYLNFTNQDMADNPQKFEFNNQILSKSMLNQSSKSPKSNNQLQKQQQIIKNSNISQDNSFNLLDKLQREQVSFPSLNNNSIKVGYQPQMLANFQKNLKNQQQKNKVLEQRNYQWENSKIRSNSLIYFDENQNMQKQSHSKQPSSNLENLFSHESKLGQNKQLSACSYKNKNDINNFYCNLGDIIIEKKNTQKKNNSIQYDNIKTIDEQETLINILDKSQSQFNQLRKYYYKKYSNICV
ncbi:hypothetical protein ABPG72_016496 [Tetrahymena utriculariae]